MTESNRNEVLPNDEINKMVSEAFRMGSNPIESNRPSSVQETRNGSNSNPLQSARKDEKFIHLVGFAKLIEQVRKEQKDKEGQQTIY